MRHLLNRIRTLAAATLLAGGLVTLPAPAIAAAAPGFAPASHPLSWGHPGYNVNGYN